MLSSNTAGPRTLRVFAKGSGTGTAVSKEFTITRTMVLRAASAGTKKVNQPTNIWGYTGTGLKVFTQVKVNGKWSTSNTTTAGEEGNYLIPVTYNPGVVGTYQYRTYTTFAGKTYYSNEVTLKRTR